MKPRKLIALLIPALFALLQCHAMPAPKVADIYTASHLTMREGLSHNFVEDIFRDSKGFIWIATSGSLARYDGYRFVNFTPNSPARYLKSTFVRKLAEDSRGRLWVASDGGIDIIDTDNLSPVELPDPTGKFRKICRQPSGYISVSAEGDIWIRTYEEIICLHFDEEGNLADIVSIPHHSKSIYITGAVKPVSGDGIWAGIGGKVCKLSYSAGKIKTTPISQGLAFDVDVNIADFLEKNGRIWVATDIGLFCYDRKSDQVKSYHTGLEEAGMLSQNVLTSLAVSPRGNLIVGSLNGMNVYDETSDRFSHLKLSDLSREHLGLNSDFINCLLLENGNLWVGTEGCGIGLIHPRSLFAKTLRHNYDNPASLSPNPVNAIYEDSEGNVWIGTVEGGLNRGRSDFNGGFSHFRFPDVLSHNSVSAITGDRDGHLWVGTWGGGLNLLSRTNPNKKATVFRTTDNARHKLDYIGTLAYDPYNNAIWIGANLGIYIYNINSGRLSLPFPEAANAKGSVASVVSADGILWIGGLEGMYAIDLRRRSDKDFSFRRYLCKLDKPETEAAEKITALAVANDGTLWVGSNGNGIYRRTFVDGKETFVNYSTADGLPNDVAHGIAEDTHGNVWVSTYHGLACLKKDGQIVNYDCSNGIDTEQFYWNASLRLANGDILFGSVDGLLAVKGEAPESDNKSFPVVFTSASSDSGQSYALSSGGMSIPEDEKSMEMAFSSLDFAGGRQGHFFYRMVGFDDEWKELPTGRNSVSYTNLSPGDYSLEVKYVAAGQSAHSAPVSSFKIEIVPNLYKRWWFIFILLAAALAIVWTIYRWRVRDLTKQRNNLRNAVDEGVKEISQQKNLIEAHAKELLIQNEELKHRNAQISEQKTQLAEMNRKVQKMTVDRISFFTNITHEFRTPITLIIGPIERALKLSSNPKVIEQLNFVERNSKYLLSLINQLMDFRKVEAGKIEILPTRSNFEKFVEEVVLPFRAYAEERHIEIGMRFHIRSAEFSYDREAIRKVLINLLGNAIKFTPDNGRVTLYAALFKSTLCNHPNTLYISVSDTGNGIDEADIDKVFNRFYQGKSQIKYPLIGASDSGIGLYLCRKIMEVYGGNISVRNNHGAGCTFRVLVGVPDEDLAIKVDSDATSGNAGQSSGDAPQAESGTRLTVLVVEDNSDMRSYVRSILTDFYDVVEAADGREGLDILLSRNIDFVISDLMMPVMDGIEFSKRVKENFEISHIPFLMLTAKTSSESRLEGYRSGVDEYLQKPFDEEILLARIKNILENKRRYQRQFTADLKTDALNVPEESVDKKFVDKLLESLANNYKNSYFDVGDLAESLGVSRSLLGRKVQSLVGETPTQFIRTYRLKIARELLLKNRTSHAMNISEIAFEVGFNDSKYFTRCFTRHFGLPPSSLLKDKPD